MRGEPLFALSRRLRMASTLPAAFVCVAVWLVAAARAQDAFVLTQVPRELPPASPKSSMDTWYPNGTRIVLSKAPFAPDHVTVLTAGLIAAGSPVLSYDGRLVVFAGKKTAASDWQIYETAVSGGQPRALTDFPGGATHPALLANGSLVFAARAATTASLAPEPVPQLYLQTSGEQPRQLTFAPAGATDPTMLLDGRILFVSAQPGENKRVGSPAETGTALYTINNDGTELTAFACQHDLPTMVCRPRQLNDGRLAFLSTDDLSSTSSSQNQAGRKCAGFTVETVRMARPFSSRAKLLEDSGQSQASQISGLHVRSVQPCGASNVLICAAAPATEGRFCCFLVNAETRSLGAPLIAHPSYEIIEAVAAVPSTPPMGRLSTMDTTKRTGQILCLDINDTILSAAGQPAPKAVRVRLLTGTAADPERILGEIDVQPDGSFMAEVPADLPLGFEALDEHGQVVRREAPNLWVRSGENRACVGCHAQHNRAPHNHRPLAVRVPVPNFCNLAQTNVVTQARK